MILKNDTLFKESLEGLGLIEDSGAFHAWEALGALQERALLFLLGPWGVPLQLPRLGSCSKVMVIL